eukprot:353796-Chlamydomonas_euryale.AAC.3
MQQLNATHPRDSDAPTHTAVTLPPRTAAAAAASSRPSAAATSSARRQLSPGGGVGRRVAPATPVPATTAVSECSAVAAALSAVRLTCSSAATPDVAACMALAESSSAVQLEAATAAAAASSPPMPTPFAAAWAAPPPATANGRGASCGVTRCPSATLSDSGGDGCGGALGEPRCGCPASHPDPGAAPPPRPATKLASPTAHTSPPGWRGGTLRLVARAVAVDAAAASTRAAATSAASDSAGRSVASAAKNDAGGMLAGLSTANSA